MRKGKEYKSGGFVFAQIGFHQTLGAPQWSCPRAAAEQDQPGQPQPVGTRCSPLLAGLGPVLGAARAMGLFHSVRTDQRVDSY